MNKVMETLAEYIKLDLRSKDFQVSFPYQTTIEVVGISNDSIIWIRVLQSNAGVIVDISNIAFDSRFRRHGLFTGLINQLMTNKNIAEIRVTSVSTEPMHLACKKLNMSYDDISMSYSLVVK